MNMLFILFNNQIMITQAASDFEWRCNNSSMALKMTLGFWPHALTMLAINYYFIIHALLLKKEIIRA